MSSRFQLVAEFHDAYGVKRLCQVLQIGRSSYYKWLAGAARREQRQAADAAVAARAAATTAEFDGTYGSPRVTAELRGAGVVVNVKRVARVMREHGIIGVHLRKKVRTTVPAKKAPKVPDLLERDFTADAPTGSSSVRPPAATWAALAVAVLSGCTGSPAVGDALAMGDAPWGACHTGEGGTTVTFGTPISNGGDTAIEIQDVSLVRPDGIVLAGSAVVEDEADYVGSSLGCRSSTYRRRARCSPKRPLAGSASGRVVRAVRPIAARGSPGSDVGGGDELSRVVLHDDMEP
ncbi:hypothetical protein GCM10028784_35280 [Myceligenerans cantabricum]